MSITFLLDESSIDYRHDIREVLSNLIISLSAYFRFTIDFFHVGYKAVFGKMQWPLGPLVFMTH